MSLSTVLDVVIGMVFMYFLLGQVCSLGFEWLAGMFNFRGRYLKASIARMFEADRTTDQELVNDFYKQEAVKAIMIGNRLPADISPVVFAKVIAKNYVQGLGTIAQPDGLPPKQVVELSPVGNKSDLLKHVALNSTDVDEFQNGIQLIFAQKMALVTSHYQRLMRPILLALGLVAAVAFDADSFRMVTTLWNQPTLATTTALQAQKQVSQMASQPNEQQQQTAIAALKTLESSNSLPLGWVSSKPGVKGAPSKGFENDDERYKTWLGWIITAFAVSFGAPFWYDLLNKMTALRQSTTGQPASPATPNQAPAGAVTTVQAPVATAPATPAPVVAAPAGTAPGSQH